MIAKYKIVALFGEAGSGKTSIQKALMETVWGKLHLSPIVSYTTRPPREGEIDGVHYVFKNNNASFFGVPLLECACFNKWWYGTSTDNLVKEKINIGIFNIKGINQILQNDNVNCLPIRIIRNDKLRLIGQLNREPNPDCLEICRRFQTDKEDFLNIPFHYKAITNDYNEFSSIVNDIIPIIIHWALNSKDKMD